MQPPGSAYQQKIVRAGQAIDISVFNAPGQSCFDMDYRITGTENTCDPGALARKRSEELLSESEARLTLAATSAESGMCDLGDGQRSYLGHGKNPAVIWVYA